MSDRKDIRDLSWPLLDSYCKRHGYNFVTRTEIIDRERHPSWSKLLFLKSLIPAYDIVVWFDDDILLTRPEMRIEEILEPFIESEHVMAVSSNNTAPFNFGLIVAKSTAGPVLDQIYDAVTEETRFGLYWEETASGVLYRTSEDFRHKVYIFPVGLLQGFHLAACHPAYKWIPTCFSMHVAGLPKEYRIQKMVQTWEELDLKSRFCLHESPVSE
jgi:hypothetical protein